MTGAPPESRLWTPWRVGLVGVAFIIFGSGWYQVWYGPPYRYVDEQAHVGYVLEIQGRRLPEIDTPIDVDNGGPELRERLTSERPRRRDVWVANNPPLPYLAAAAPAAITRALGVSGGALVGVRLLNLLSMTAAVVLACRIGRTLSGGDDRAGVVTGAVFAAAPHTGFLAGLGMTDGMALLAVVGTIEATTRPMKNGARQWWTTVLLWASFGAAVRPMSAVLCAAAVVLASGARGLGLLREEPVEMGVGGGDGRSRPWARVKQGASAMVAAGLIAMSGAWYVRNQVLYGDPTGSDHLFAKFDRAPRGLGEFTPSNLKVMVDTLFLRRLQNELETDPLGWSPVIFGLIIVGVVGLLVTALLDRRSNTSRIHLRGAEMAGADRPGPGAVRFDLLVGLGLLALVNIALVVQHWSGGGGVHPRYALLLVPILVAPLAATASRWSGPVGSLALVVAPLAVLWHQVPISSAWVNDHKTAPLSSPLTMSIGPDWWRLGGLALIAAGTVLVAIALVGTARNAAWRTRGRGD